MEGIVVNLNRKCYVQNQVYQDAKLRTYEGDRFAMILTKLWLSTLEM